MDSRTPRSHQSRAARLKEARARSDARVRTPKASTSRDERKEATRRSILDAALNLLSERSFSALSLREVAREAGIAPTAFYRHFDSMDALGLVLIDESFRTLRDMLRSARTGQLDPSRIIESSIDILIKGVRDDPEHWRFIARERHSGVSTLRHAIRSEIRVITSELAVDLARIPGLNTWTHEDLSVLSSLMVNSMISIAEATEDASDPAAIEDIRRTAVRQLRMILIGVVNWRSGEPAAQ
ncbi:MAG: TetR family transcriptional regulator [Mycolicibacterium insubricum]|uniref:TetR family transcriptional regulator n=1 Tax=Mycolicibacterium insubricum TaxID=444597 RepID=A0A1X0DHB1_9MYCO|nr:TetR family transcriptional regulator [Mycolicibacterium insubricum]MCB0928458.1 TetR family transcriptional regulator [Mycobacterium sp.]MCB9440685.1 TetR family transcriptional regulator [Mycolicibacterium sp.]ORA71758.1 TetR family transcriptional regulator [Mycolicibacterium insubricum]BBZ65624.1 TetR family transcriptional regulator [Mycolicibacterium insubricum]